MLGKEGRDWPERSLIYLLNKLSEFLTKILLQLLSKLGNFTVFIGNGIKWLKIKLHFSTYVPSKETFVGNMTSQLVPSGRVEGSGNVTV